MLPYFNKASKIKAKYEKVIKELCDKVYDINYEIDDLYKAWKLRQYCPIVSLSDDDEFGIDEYFTIAKIDKKYNTKKINGSMIVYN